MSESITIEIPSIKESTMDNIVNKVALESIKNLEVDLSNINVSKSELAPINGRNELELTPELKSLELVKDIEPVLEEYNKKYRTEFKFDDFKSALTWAVTGSKSDRELKRIINNELIFNASEFLIIKGVLAMCKIINNLLDNILAKDLTAELNGDTMSIITELWDWLDKLELVKARYAQYDIDKKIKRLVNSDLSLQSGLNESYKRVVELLKSNIMNSTGN